MSFTEAVRSVLSQYAGFSGRAPRSEFWWWVLFVNIVMIAAYIIDSFVIAPMLGRDASTEMLMGAPLSNLITLGFLLPNLAVNARRLHDTDRSGWWQLIGLIPLIGVIVLIYWFVHRGTDGANRFGEARIPPRGTGGG